MSKTPYKVRVTMTISAQDGYSERAVHSADLVATGPLTVDAALPEAKSLAESALRTIRVANDRAKAAACAEEKVADPDEIASPF